ncbi:type II toxin-antitoxin system VapC family toxin (plasmid) [Roseomonas mucosa]|uniref:type II toxin-antitoxin system VapC family toxin n=1 Tax=Roseomonas mucosa TaxID=207340 RepID=UPI0030D378C6
MIAVDTSALMAILLDEPEADACMDVLQAADALAISAGTVAEALIVAGRRDLGAEMRRLVEGLGFEVASVTPGTARRMAEAYARWGKGVHPAGLNFGDCFAYVLAIEHDAPLLYVGEDFSRTDVRPAR